jgi:hypothetical protein
MPATRGKFSPLLAPGLAAIFFQQLKLRSTEHTKWINMKKSRRAWEEEYKLTGLGSMYRKAEGGVYTFDEPISGDTIKYTHLTYGLGFRVTQEMMEDDLYGVMQKMSKWLARSASLNKEVQAFSVLNNAFSASYVGLDGVSLCNTAHPRLDGGTAQSNKSSADFSMAELQTAIEAYENLTDDRGFKVDVTPKFLVHGPSLIWEVNKVLGSEYEPGTADNDINVVRSKYNVIPVLVHYLTDSDSWYLLSDKSQHDMKMWTRVDDQFKNSDDPLTGDALFTSRHRLSVGFGDWRGVYGSPGA